MKALILALILVPACVFAQLSGPDYVSVMYDLQGHTVYPLDLNSRLETTASDLSDLQTSLDVVSNAAFEPVEFGGPKFPYFVQATGLRTNFGWTAVYHFIPVEEQDVVGVHLARVVQESAPAVFTDTVVWTNKKPAESDFEPHFISTDTMVWSAGPPNPFVTVAGGYTVWTGFYWKVAGPATGYWGVSYGSYTGLFKLVKSPTYSNTNWFFAGDIGPTDDYEGSLRYNANNDLYTLATTPGKSTSPFVNYSKLDTSNAVRNINFWAYDVDLTCVAPFCKTIKTQANGYYGKYASHTAVTRQHIVAANHWHMNPSNGVLHFYDRDNNLYTRSIVRGARIGSTDCWVGMLDEPLPDVIKPAEILNTNDWPKLLVQFMTTNTVKQGYKSYYPCSRGLNLEAILYRPYVVRSGWSTLDGNANAGQINGITNNCTYYKTDTAWHQTDAWIGGESSSPVFLWINGHTVLANTVRNSDGAGPNISKLSSQIEALIRSWGGTTETNLYWLDLSHTDGSPRPRTDVK